LNFQLKNSFCCCILDILNGDSGVFFVLKVFKKMAVTEKPILYLHIGTNKTGTTSIQNFLEKNSENLKSNGILYPDVGRLHGAHYIVSASLGFKANPDAYKDILINPTSLKKKLLKEINESKCKKIIISSEDFMLKTKDYKTVQDFFSGFDVRVIVYLRRHDEWWESAYIQALKMKSNPPWGMGVMSFIKFHTAKHSFFGNYVALLEQWSSIFCRENIIVRPFEKAQFKGGLLEDFMSNLDFWGFENLNFEKERYNESVSRLGVGLLDVFQRLDTSDKTRKKLIEYALSLPKGEFEAPLIKPNIKKDIIDGYQKDYYFIAEKYLGRVDGDLFVEDLKFFDDWKPVYCDPKTTGEHILKAIGL